MYTFPSLALLQLWPITPSLKLREKRKVKQKLPKYDNVSSIQYLIPLCFLSIILIPESICKHNRFVCLTAAGILDVVVWSGDKMEQKMVRKGTCLFEATLLVWEKLREASICWATRSRAVASGAYLQPEATSKGLLWNRVGKRQLCWKGCVIPHSSSAEDSEAAVRQSRGPLQYRTWGSSACCEMHFLQEDSWYARWLVSFMAVNTEHLSSLSDLVF